MRLIVHSRFVLIFCFTFNNRNWYFNAMTWLYTELPASPGPCMPKFKMTHALTHLAWLPETTLQSHMCVCVSQTKRSKLSRSQSQLGERGRRGRHRLRSFDAIGRTRARRWARMCAHLTMYMNTSAAYQWRRSANRATATHSLHVRVRVCATVDAEIV